MIICASRATNALSAGFLCGYGVFQCENTTNLLEMNSHARICAWLVVLIRCVYTWIEKHSRGTAFPSERCGKSVGGALFSVYQGWTKMKLENRWAKKCSPNEDEPPCSIPIALACLWAAIFPSKGFTVKCSKWARLGELWLNHRPKRQTLSDRSLREISRSFLRWNHPDSSSLKAGISRQRSATRPFPCMKALKTFQPTILFSREIMFKRLPCTKMIVESWDACLFDLP